MVAPFDVFVKDVKCYTWIGVAQTVQEAKSLALRHPKASSIRNIIIFNAVTQGKIEIAIDGDGGAPSPGI